MKTTVIYHSADYDGIFCREIARKFLPDAELIGWDFADKPLDIPVGQIYVLDLPIDYVFGFDFKNMGALDSLDDAISISQPDSQIRAFLVSCKHVVWIDHHASSIVSHPKSIPGYRIDGVAACRLVWQYFTFYDKVPNKRPISPCLPKKQHYVDRVVSEPLAVRLAGEYDIWDRRDPNAELFSMGLQSQEITPVKWQSMLSGDQGPDQAIGHRYNTTVLCLLNDGKILQYAKQKENESIIKIAGFTVEFEGLKFLACNHARYNSFLFTAGLTLEHDACLGFAWRAGKWNVSLYHAPGKEHHDLSKIATKYGGGGHKGACGFQLDNLKLLGI